MPRRRNNSNKKNKKPSKRTTRKMNGGGFLDGFAKIKNMLPFGSSSAKKIEGYNTEIGVYKKKIEEYQTKIDALKTKINEENKKNSNASATQQTSPVNQQEEKTQPVKEEQPKET